MKKKNLKWIGPEIRPFSGTTTPWTGIEQAYDGTGSLLYRKKAWNERQWDYESLRPGVVPGERNLKPET